MRFDVLIWMLAALPVGLIFYFFQVRGIKAHIKSLGGYLRFFFWPFGPRRMLIIQELDGKFSIFYDDDFEETASERRAVIRTRCGDEFISRLPFSEAAKVVSLYDAKGPEGYPSPFSLSWRWVVGAAVTVFLLYVAWIISVIPAIEIVPMKIGGMIVNVAQVRPINPWEVTVTTTLFMFSLMWLILNINRMDDRTIQYGLFQAYGINPPHQLVAPVPINSNVSVLKYFQLIGREVSIVIPSDVKSLLEEVESKTGNRSLAAIILARLSMANTWRQSLAEALRESLKIWKAGETSAAIRLNMASIQKKMIPVIAVTFIVGLILGFAAGNFIGIGVEPVPSAPSNMSPSNASIGISPAQPPPPPGITQSILFLSALDLRPPEFEPGIFGLGGEAHHLIARWEYV